MSAVDFDKADAPQVRRAAAAARPVRRSSCQPAAAGGGGAARVAQAAGRARRRSSSPAPPSSGCSTTPPTRVALMPSPGWTRRSPKVSNWTGRKRSCCRCRRNARRSQQARAALQAATSTEVLWSRQLDLVRQHLSEDVGLTSFTVTPVDAGATGGSATGASGADHSGCERRSLRRRPAPLHGGAATTAPTARWPGVDAAGSAPDQHLGSGGNNHRDRGDGRSRQHPDRRGELARHARTSCPDGPTCTRRT